jgi:tetratricopeptide (TPR) repeat protein
MDDLDRAIEINDLAVASLPNNHIDLSMYLNNSALALRVRFERTGVVDDIDKAILICDKAIGSMPNDHPALAMYLNNLGKALQSRFERSGSMGDVDRAIEVMETFAMSTARPSLRLHIAGACSDLLVRQRNYKRAKLILDGAVRILLSISPRTLKQSDQQYNISLFANITSRAVSVSLANTEDPFDALQLLELGRGIISNLQLEVRSDISVLGSYPEHRKLAQQFQELRDRIDAPSVTIPSSAAFDSHSI